MGSARQQSTTDGDTDSVRACVRAGAIKGVCLVSLVKGAGQGCGSRVRVKGAGQRQRHIYRAIERDR